MGLPLTILFERVKSKNASNSLSKREATRIHLKRDGYCLLAGKDENGHLIISTRTPTVVYSNDPAKDVYSYSQINKFVEKLDRMPANSLVYGEGFVQGKTSHAVRSALAANPTEDLSFEVFCVEKWGNVDYISSFEYAEML